MQYGSYVLPVVTVMFVGSLAIAILGAEKRGRVPFEVAGWMLAGVAVRYGIGLAFGTGIAEQCPMDLLAMIIGIGASLARWRANQLVKLEDFRPE